MTNDSIIERIQKLLAMAEHDGSNANEAAIALEMAQKLLLEHNLTRTQVEAKQDEDIGVLQTDVVEFQGLNWKGSLLNVLAKTNLCHVVLSKYSHSIHVFGSYDNLSSVMGMYHWIIPQLEEMSAQGWQQNKVRVWESARAWRTSFFYGAIDSIKQRLQPAFDSFSQGAGHSLVLLSKQQVMDRVHEEFPSLSKGRRIYLGSNRGFSAGVEAGRRVTLSSASHLSGGRLALR